MAPEATAPEASETPEFPTEEHRDTHISALRYEKQGYEAKAKGLKARGDNDQGTYYEGRANEVAEELKRLGDSATTGRSRAARR